MKCGGTGDEKSATEEIQALIDAIRGDLETKAGKSFPQYKAVSYRSQDVAGTNYFIKVHVLGTSYVHLRVFKSLHTGGDPELHSYKLGMSDDDELEYF